jgi:hypothetical protein
MAGKRKALTLEDRISVVCVCVFCSALHFYMYNVFIYMKCLLSNVLCSH